MTLKVVSESRVTWVTSVPILVFLGLSVLDLGPMYATDRLQRKASLNAPLGAGGIIMRDIKCNKLCGLLWGQHNMPHPPQVVT